MWTKIGRKFEKKWNEITLGKSKEVNMIEVREIGLDKSRRKRKNLRQEKEKIPERKEKSKSKI
jgi:hypothetical protein